MTQRETEGDETALGDTAHVWKDAQGVTQTLRILAL